MDRQQVDQQVQKILDQVRQRIVEQASPSLQSLAQMEKAISSELNQCKPQILQAWCDHAQDDSARPLCPHCGGPMRHKGSRSRTLICEAGQIDVPRTRWWCDACQASFFPLDNTTSVANYPVTPQAAQVAVEEAAERPYEQVVAHLARRHQIRLGKELLENLTQTVGAYWLDQDRQRLATAQAQHTAPVEQFPAQQCLIFAEGVMVHTDGDWHEARVGTVRSRSPDGETRKSSIVRFGEVQAFGEDLWRHACELGYRRASLVAFLADGSHGLWAVAARHFQRAILIVDFWHVCDNVCACGRIFYGEGTDEAQQWSGKVCERLRAGAVDEALRQVETLNPRGSKARREAKHALVTYLTNNRERMDYPRYEALGLPIGSGEVEAQCKTLVQARGKQAGMRWHTNGVEPLLRVRCALKDGRYRQEFGHWPDDLSAWQARRKQQARAA